MCPFPPFVDRLRAVSDVRPIQRVLVADRGEVGVRLLRVLEANGLEGIAVFSDADADAPWLDSAAYAVRIPPSPSGTLDPYMDPAGIVSAALDSGADAVHPGLHGLARSADFARTLHNVGLMWLGPRLDDLTWTVDRVLARARAREAGLEILPSSPLLFDPDAVEAWCERFGFPMVIRPGRRLAMRSRVVHDRSSARRAVAEAAEVGVFAERALPEARHVAVVVVGDGYGNAVHVGEHELSLLGPAGVRLRECPSAGVDGALRARIGQGAADFLAASRYFGVGAVHFLIGGDGLAWFLDVEPGLPEGFALHDKVYGVDLVGAQVALASGEELGWDQDDIAPDGCAAEVAIALRRRGRATRLEFADPACVDTAVSVGQRVDPARYPILARVRVSAPTRNAALVRLRANLEGAVVEGVETDLAACVELLADLAVWEGRTARRITDRR